MENVSDLLPRLECFENIKRVLKQARVSLRRNDALHYRNRLLVCWISKFVALKEFH